MGSWCLCIAAVNASCVAKCGKPWGAQLDAKMNQVCGKDYQAGPDCEACVRKNMATIKSGLEPNSKCTVKFEEENNFCYDTGGAPMIMAQTGTSGSASIDKYGVHGVDALNSVSDVCGDKCGRLRNQDDS